MADFGRSTLPKNDVLRVIFVIATVAGLVLLLGVPSPWKYLGIPMLLPAVGAFLANKIG